MYLSLCEIVFLVAFCPVAFGAIGYLMGYCAAKDEEKAKYKKRRRDLNDPIRIERRMKLAHLFGLLELEKECWVQLQALRTNE